MQISNSFSVVPYWMTIVNPHSQTDLPANELIEVPVLENNGIANAFLETITEEDSEFESSDNLSGQMDFHIEMIGDIVERTGVNQVGMIGDLDEPEDGDNLTTPICTEFNTGVVMGRSSKLNDSGSGPSATRTDHLENTFRHSNMTYGREDSLRSKVPSTIEELRRTTKDDYDEFLVRSSLSEGSIRTSGVSQRNRVRIPEIDPKRLNAETDTLFSVEECVSYQSNRRNPEGHWPNYTSKSHPTNTVAPEFPHLMTTQGLCIAGGPVIRPSAAMLSTFSGNRNLSLFQNAPVTTQHFTLKRSSLPCTSGKVNTFQHGNTSSNNLSLATNGTTRDTDRNSMGMTSKPMSSFVLSPKQNQGESSNSFPQKPETYISKSTPFYEGKVLPGTSNDSLTQFITKPLRLSVNSNPMLTTSFHRHSPNTYPLTNQSITKDGKSIYEGFRHATHEGNKSPQTSVICSHKVRDPDKVEQERPLRAGKNANYKPGLQISDDPVWIANSTPVTHSSKNSNRHQCELNISQSPGEENNRTLRPLHRSPAVLGVSDLLNKTDEELHQFMESTVQTTASNGRVGSGNDSNRKRHSPMRRSFQHVEKKIYSGQNTFSEEDSDGLERRSFYDYGCDDDEDDDNDTDCFVTPLDYEGIDSRGEYSFPFNMGDDLYEEVMSGLKNEPQFVWTDSCQQNTPPEYATVRRRSNRLMERWDSSEVPYIDCDVTSLSDLKFYRCRPKKANMDEVTLNSKYSHAINSVSSISDVSRTGTYSDDRFRRTCIPRFHTRQSKEFQKSSRTDDLHRRCTENERRELDEPNMHWLQRLCACVGKSRTT